jgi:hypothetical protein
VAVERSRPAHEGVDLGAEQLGDLLVDELQVVVEAILGEADLDLGLEQRS